MKWTYNGQVFTEDMIDKHVGFVYLITNETTGMKYVGKKLFTKSKITQKNKKKKRSRVSSDWETYTGSNELLNESIDLGARITKEILHLCETRGWLTYLETKEILVRDAILSNSYYNMWFTARVHRRHLEKKATKNGRKKDSKTQIST